ncbi:MAG: (d)CMP kinase [Oscillospiraceae bacterium]|nr:(d)CMP kinase [Oscillospiraceae bacterium]
MSLISIAIDGPAGAGKSTIARKVAQELGCLYVDTGAIYRTVGLYALRKGTDPKNEGEVVPLLEGLKVEMQVESDGIQHMYLNGEDVTAQIREPEISRYASAVSALPPVRAFLLDMQRELARTRSVVMDGRDIGTVVLPDATVKIFLTASPEVRATRRWKELQEKGNTDTDEEVLRDVIQRDYDDSHRAIAPLRQAEDAVLADTSKLDLEESIQLLLNIIKERQ